MPLTSRRASRAGSDFPLPQRCSAKNVGRARYTFGVNQRAPSSAPPGRRKDSAVVALAAAEPSDYSERGPREFDRTPPQNIDAEMSVLGGMLLSKDAIADVIEALKPGDFYRPAHQIVCEAILDLYSRGPSPPTRSPCRPSSSGRARSPGSEERVTCIR